MHKKEIVALEKTPSDITILVNSSPQKMLNAIYLDENFVKIKPIAKTLAFLSKTPSKLSTKLITLKTDRFIAHNNAPLGE